MSINRWMDKEDVVFIYMYIYIHTYIHTHTHTHNGILLSHKKEWNNVFCSNLNRPRDYHTKWSKSDSEWQISYDITYMWNLKKKKYKWTYLQNRNRATDIENKLMVTKGERGGRDKLGVWD